MRTLGILVAVCGLVVAGYYGLVYDTKQKLEGSLAGAGFELSLEDPEREEERRTGMFLGLGAVAAGGVMVALSAKKR